MFHNGIIGVGMLELKNLSKNFGKKKAVDNLSMSLEAGDIFGFIGPNGAGKTTTLKMIVGILEADSGEVIVDGENLKDNDLSVKSKIAYIPDNPEIYDFLKGIDYLNFMAGVFNVDNKRKDELIEYYAKDLDLYDNLGDLVSSYSHGMKQKLAIIGALIHEPKLFILDEPFVGLDPIATHKLKTYFKQHVKEGGTVLFSTHVLEVAEKLCNKIAIIKEAKLIKVGKTKDITKDKSLENVFLELGNE